jgi:signal transduction histidine kinase
MRADGMVRLTVSDDGVGFVPRSAGDSGGVGLVNMRERVRYLNGTFVLESEPDHGTTIRAEVPFLNPSNPTVRQQWIARHGTR